VIGSAAAAVEGARDCGRAVRLGDGEPMDRQRVRVARDAQDRTAQFDERDRQGIPAAWDRRRQLRGWRIRPVRSLMHAVSMACLLPNSA
jgi:hypothetical protein